MKFDSNGLVPAILQDAATGEVLMMAYMNEESLKRTLESKEA
ncbi:MAG: bifunctional phosphoribosyl-AMP cyclohydrolase/phosphoribosyl-ATP pyrophosphatase, partial [Dehalococcoidia bacterium]|nr:bifunctional phosphoribosyl-AMP cyclohydrolase/phosphoribosyl-ATP pyrophosphatase [Dehalococcoidia bacterium]